MLCPNEVFPTPGAAFLGFDPVKVYLDAITAGQSGWGTSPTVLFRFSGPVDFDSDRKAVPGSGDGDGAAGAVSCVIQII